eukprot:6241310-Karenia_brevis.AAC.1
MNWELQWYQGQIRLKDHAGDIWQPNPQYGWDPLELCWKGQGRHSCGRGQGSIGMGWEWRGG